MPEVLEERRDSAGGLEPPVIPSAPAAAPGPAPAAPPGSRPPTRLDERGAREDLRAQIAALERRLGEAFAAAFPRQGIDWRVGAVGGPRILSTGELERIRDALAYRLRTAEAEIGRRVDREEASRGLLEEMIAEPERHRWVRISNRHIGEPGCRHWHSRPRWGILGMLLNWWRVKVSSGCPLAAAGRPRPARPTRPRPAMPGHPRQAMPGHPRPERPDRRAVDGQ